MKILKNSFFWSVVLTVWMLTLVILTVMPGSKTMEKFSGSGIRWDYLEHFFLYSVIPVLYFMWRSAGNSTGTAPTILRHQGFALFIGLAFAVVTEVYQIWIPGRAFNPVDLGLNVGGIFVSFIICYFWKHYANLTG
jgi:VanZ family protein